MSFRNTLVLRAAKANVVAANYPNDSKLEQAVIYAEKQSVATSTATTLAAPVNSPVAGGANV